MNTRSTWVREFKVPPGEPVRAQYFDLLTPAVPAEERSRTVYILDEFSDTDPRAAHQLSGLALTSGVPVRGLAPASAATSSTAVAPRCPANKRFIVDPRMHGMMIDEFGGSADAEAPELIKQHGKKPVAGLIAA